MATGMLQVFSININVLYDFGASLSLINPTVAKKFDVYPDILSECYNPGG